MMSLMEAGALAGALQAANEHGLLQALAERPMSAAELAGSADLAEVPCERVLEVLRTNGLLERAADRYAPSPVVLAELRGPHGRLEENGRFWAHMTEYLRSGEPFQLMRDTRDRGDVYAEATRDLGVMFSGVAGALARELAQRLGDRPSLRVLDVGAGSGVWSLAILAETPTATSLAVDLPPVLPRFIERADALGVGSRADVLAGDFHRAIVERAGYDLVLLANVVHLEAAPAAQALVRRWGEAVAPDGALVIVDMLDGADDADRVHASYALHLGMRVPGAFPHHEGDLRAWLAAAGLPRIERVMFAEPFPSLGALIARR
jgi:SAM-dependent methyltransferase